VTQSVNKDWVRALATVQRLTEPGDAALARVVHAHAAAHGDAPALIGTGETLTYAALSGRINRYARWALAEGLAAGDVVALNLANAPDYAAIWLGLGQVGCVVALLNTNLAAEAVARAIAVAGAKRTIDAVHRPDIARLSGEPLDGHERRPPRPSDRALLIYTSGTTGLPKATNVTHARVLEWSGWFAGMMDAVPQDRLFNALPMYHSVGGVVAVGSMLAVGGSVIVRERFSAASFWSDAAANGATIVQYIGELCRYLLRTPPGPSDTGHRVRLAVGNGLQADVWLSFQRRFAIPRILEFYAASEGAVSLTNVEGRAGALGRVPAFLRDRFAVALIACDPETNLPVRDAARRCVRVATGAPGEAIGRLGPGARFDGYTDAAASDAKILHDVFESGDRWYRTGDLLRQDPDGFYYFVDRLGDTFRWKGENVSTTEVDSVLRACPGVVDAATYGVAIAGADGKAGMAALVVDDRFDFATLHAHLAERLPSYARPLFVRLCPALETTGTFRPRKVDLAREGYALSTDPVWRDAGTTFAPAEAPRD
jgi:fatty-acyl-CoA synthase